MNTARPLAVLIGCDATGGDRGLQLNLIQGAQIG